MQILFLTQIVPYPPDSGPKVKTYHVLRYLAGQGHQIFLASFVRSEERESLEALRPYCQEVHAIPIRRSRAADMKYWLRSLLTRRPFLVERDDLPEMRRVVADVLVRNAIDYIHADQLTMAQFGLPPVGLFGGEKAGSSAGKPPSLVFDAHNATWTIVERMLQTVPFYLRLVLALEAVRVKRYEGMVVRLARHTLAVTDIDRDDLLKACRYENGADGGNLPITTIPIAVDTQALAPVERQPGSMNIVTLGTLHYPPNADGIRWFIRDVFPKVRSEIPNVTLTIAGKNPPADFIQLAENQAPAIRVAGYVPDLQPLMESSAIMVVPVRAGSGMRVRILEAFARGMPVVTTTIGLEGIQARPGKDVMVADNPDDFASAVVNTLRDPGVQSSLAHNGRVLAESVYDWQVALKKLENVYGSQ